MRVKPAIFYTQSYYPKSWRRLLNTILWLWDLNYKFILNCELWNVKCVDQIWKSPIENAGTIEKWGPNVMIWDVNFQKISYYCWWKSERQTHTRNGLTILIWSTTFRWTPRSMNHIRTIETLEHVRCVPLTKTKSNTAWRNHKF